MADHFSLQSNKLSKALWLLLVQEVWTLQPSKSLLCSFSGGHAMCLDVCNQRFMAYGSLYPESLSSRSSAYWFSLLREFTGSAITACS
uniref:Secreted protein n=1 Tax=Arion vulgaris TaxID=1028688 RepID=A0A0B7B977_9EUPU